MDNIDWSKIKDSYVGFEKLAYEFVTKKFPNSSGWTHSQATHDNNRDAYTIIFGYQPYAASPEQWWMEAKYSTKSQRLSRYRLDATIVSAILSKNVTKVIFVTNVVISAKVMLDIRSALMNAIDCKNVYFFSKYTLEYWLLQNQDILRTYFPEYENAKDLKLSSYFITEEIEYFGAPDNRLCFKEPLHCLYIGQKYFGYFSVFSDKKRILQIKVASYLKGIKILSHNKISLKEGENSLHFEFLIEDNFKSDRSNTPEVLAFKLGRKDLLSKENIIPETTQRKIRIDEQEKIKDNILNCLKIFCKKSTQQIHLITGVTCIGKTFLIDELLSSAVLSGENVFSVEFRDSPVSNVQLILNTLLFILFPYISPTDIDKKYLDALNINTEFSDTLIELVEHKFNFEKQEAIISELNKDSVFFPLELSINRRIIFLDDVSKLKTHHRKFLFQIIEEVAEKNLPLFIVMCGQPQLLDSAYYALMKKVYIQHYEYEISSATIMQCIQKLYPLNFQININLLQSIFPNLIELFTFITYLNETKPEISTVNEFIAICKLFQRSGIWEKSLIKIFRNLYNQNQEGFRLCANIYWSYEGIEFKEFPINYQNVLYQLFAQNLIKTNKEGLIVPFHDVYTKIFRKRYKLKECDIFIHTKCDIENIQDAIHFTTDKTELLKTVKKLEKLCNSQKFYSLHYILSEIFENTSINQLENRFGEQIFYRLYRLYALACTNISKDFSGKALFEKIYQKTYSSKDGEVLLVCTSVIWELINSYYEWLDFQQSEFYASKLKQVISRLQNLGILDRDNNKFVRYQNMLVIQTLIQSETLYIDVDQIFFARYQTMLNYGFLERAASFKVRYAHTLLVRDIYFAQNLLKESMEELKEISNENNKFYLWSLMTVHFIDLITEKEAITMQKTLQKFLNAHEKMKKNYFNDYRKRSIAIASYYLYIGDISLGEQYLMDDITINRDLRPRQYGFYCETMALYELYNSNTEVALDYLNKARNIFHMLWEYKKIIDHNINIVENCLFSKDRLKFYCDGKMKDTYFYLDPRSIY